MTADEVAQGLARLGIVHEMTLAHSPYQNGKQESFWGQVEGRLLAMLENCRDLDARRCSTRRRRRGSSSSTTATSTPRSGKRRSGGTWPVPTSGGRVPRARRCGSPSWPRSTARSGGATARSASRAAASRCPRATATSTASRCATRSWDLGQVHLVDDRTRRGAVPLFPLDRTQNADGQRRALEPIAAGAVAPPPAPGMAPLLEKLMADYAQHGPAAGVRADASPPPEPTPNKEEEPRMNKKLLSLYGLKWNPFAPDVPVEALLSTPKVENFCWRIENLAREGGFALVTGDPGSGQVRRAAPPRRASVGAARRQGGSCSRGRRRGPPTSTASWAILFGVSLAPHNRWAGAKALREQVAGAHRRRALPAGARRRRGAGDAARRAERAAALVELAARLAHPADDRPRRGRTARRSASDRRLWLRSAAACGCGSTLERATPAELEECLRHALGEGGRRRG